MNATESHTRIDTVGCSAVLLAILLSILSGVYVIYSESTPVAATESVHQA